MEKKETAVEILKVIAKRENLLKIKDIADKMNTTHSNMSRVLKDDENLSPQILDVFFQNFESITEEEEDKITLLSQISRSPKELQDEIKKIKEENKKLKSMKEEKSCNDKFNKIFNHAVKEILDNGLFDLNKYIADLKK